MENKIHGIVISRSDTFGILDQMEEANQMSSAKKLKPLHQE